MSNDITIPKLRVQVELADGSTREYDVQTDNRDAVRFDMTRTRLGWPDGQSAPVLWMTFLAWAALKRSGELDGMKVDEFLDRCTSCLPLDEDGDELQEGEEGIVARPTLQRAELG